MSCKNKQIISEALNSPYVTETACEGVILAHAYKVMLSIYYSPVRVAISLLKLFSTPTRFLNKAEWLHGLLLWRKNMPQDLAVFRMSWFDVICLHIYSNCIKFSKRLIILTSKLYFWSLSPNLLSFWQPLGSCPHSDACLGWVFMSAKHTEHIFCSETVVWHLHLLALIHFFQNYDLLPIASL